MTPNPHLSMLQEEHRQSLIGLVAHFGEYIRKREAGVRQRLKTAETLKDRQRQTRLSVQMELLEEVRGRLAELRKDFDCTSLANRVLACAHLQGRSERDPTEEEIAAACEAIQAGWSEAEREYRSHYKPQPVELKETDFLGGRS